MVHQLGQPERGRWRWSLAHRIRIRHLLGLPALSVVDLPVSGGPSTISPSSVSGGGDGASWRMVVELGGVVRAWGTYPGGQSGNPVSRRYDDRISTWQHGELSPLQVPRTPRDLPNAPELRIEAAR
jgi:penicillin amidase